MALKNIYPLRWCCVAFGILLLSVLAPVKAFTQDVESGTLNYLNYTGGFANLTLGAETKKLSPEQMAFMDGDNKIDADSCMKFEYRDTSILSLYDDLKLNAIGLRTYKGKIVNIYLFFKKDDGFKMLKDFEAWYGKCTERPGDFMYDWNAKEVTLNLRFKPDLDLGVAIFSSTNILKEIEFDKLKPNLNIMALSAANVLVQNNAEIAMAKTFTNANIFNSIVALP